MNSIVNSLFNKSNTTSSHILGLTLILTITGIALASLKTLHASEAVNKDPLPIGSIFPLQSFPRSPLSKGDVFSSILPNNSLKEVTDLSLDICDHWKEFPLPKLQTGKPKNEKAGHIILSRLLAKEFNVPGIDQEVEDANTYLLQMQPMGVAGTRHLFNPEGGYDFLLTTLTRILCRFGNREDILYPQTKKHLIENLLTLDGAEFSLSIPGTLGIAGETENHILMITSSRYLKNRQIHLSGNNDPIFNNIENGFEQKVLSILNNLKSGGLFEFNSKPYLGYTLAAIHNFADFGSPEVKEAATDLLNYIYGCFALGSLWVFADNNSCCVKEYSPFQRRIARASNSSLNSSYAAAFLMPLLAKEGAIFTVGDLPFPKGASGGIFHALTAASSSYRLPEEIKNLLLCKREGYFAKLGHGYNSSPEIFSAGKKFLLIAGGVHRERTLRNPVAEIVTHPISLFLHDDATDLKDVIHLRGKGDDFRKWNNTGVYKNFACSAGAISIPDNMKPLEERDGWFLYRLEDSLFAAVYSKKESESLLREGEQTSLLILFEKKMQEGLLDSIIAENSDLERLKSSCTIPGGDTLSYDLNSPKDRYVITAVNGYPLDRDFDNWPLVIKEYNKSVLPEDS